MIMRWIKEFLGEGEDQISLKAVDLINNLLIAKEKRFDYEKIKNHEFFTGLNLKLWDQKIKRKYIFKGVNWEILRNLNAPFKDQIKKINEINVDMVTRSSKIFIDGSLVGFFCWFFLFLINQFQGYLWGWFHRNKKKQALF